MWNAVSLFKHYARGPGVSSGLAWSGLLLLGLALTDPRLLARGQNDPAGPLAVPGRPAPLLAGLFTPRHAPAGVYQATVLPQGIGEATRLVRAAMSPSARVDSPRGAWVAQTLDALDAFGTAGPYDRSRVARLYSGHGPSVVRAPIVKDGVTIASVMLCSPYPDPTLTRLEPGTLVIAIDLREVAARQAPRQPTDGTRAPGRAPARTASAGDPALVPGVGPGTGNSGETACGRSETTLPATALEPRRSPSATRRVGRPYGAIDL